MHPNTYASKTKKDQFIGKNRNGLGCAIFVKRFTSNRTLLAWYSHVLYIRTPYLFAILKLQPLQNIFSKSRIGSCMAPEPVFVNLLRSPGIDSQPGGPVQRQHPYLTYRPARARICKRLRSPVIDSNESIPPAYVARRASTSNRVVVPSR